MSRALYNTMGRADSPIFPSLHLRQNSFSNPSVALPTSQFILQPFRCFTYVTAHSTTLLSLLLRHRLFTWRTAHVSFHFINPCDRTTGVVGQHPHYPLTFNIEVHHISYLDPVLCRTLAKEIIMNWMKYDNENPNQHLP